MSKLYISFFITTLYLIEQLNNNVMEQQDIQLDLHSCINDDEIEYLHRQLDQIFDYLIDSGHKIQRIIVRYEPKKNITAFGTVGGRYSSSFVDYFKYMPQNVIDEEIGINNQFFNDVMKRLYEQEYPDKRKVLLYMRYYGTTKRQRNDEEENRNRLELFGTLVKSRKLKTYVF